MRTDRLIPAALLVAMLAVPVHGWCDDEVVQEPPVAVQMPPLPLLPPAPQLPPPPAPLFDLFERAKAAVVTVRAQDIEAMGVAVVDGSLVLTASHAVTNTAWVEVASGDQVRQARVLYHEDSVAVLGLETPLEYVAPLELSGLETRVGQQVWTLTRTAEPGLGHWALHESRVAAVGERKFEVDIQCSAGSLGAPVLDRQGRLAGLITRPERGEVVARRPEVLGDLLRESAGEELGPPEGVGIGVDVAAQWHMPLPSSRHDEYEFGIGLEGSLLGGKHLVIPWSFRVAGTEGFWRPSSGQVNRGRFEWLVGLGGDFELTLSRDPYIPLIFQVYGIAGIGLFYEREYTHSIELVDPACDPASGACAAVVDRNEILDRDLPFVFGGGVRVHFSGIVAGIEVNTNPGAIRDDLRVMLTLGLGGRKIRIQD